MGQATAAIARCWYHTVVCQLLLSRWRRQRNELQMKGTSLSAGIDCMLNLENGKKKKKKVRVPLWLRICCSNCDLQCSSCLPVVVFNVFCFSFLSFCDVTFCFWIADRPLKMWKVQKMQKNDSSAHCFSTASASTLIRADICPAAAGHNLNNNYMMNCNGKPNRTSNPDLKPGLNCRISVLTLKDALEVRKPNHFCSPAVMCLFLVFKLLRVISNYTAVAARSLFVVIHLMCSFSLTFHPSLSLSVS